MSKTTAVKFVDGDHSMIEGLAIPYGGPFGGKDLDGEDFGPDTNFALDWFDTRPLLYHHGMDSAVKTSPIGRQIEHTMTPQGVWAKAQLDMAHKYAAVVQGLVEQGALGFSSGAPPHLVTATKSGHITRWPWTELTLTPLPANPLAVVYAVKSSDILERFAAISSDIPAPLAAALKALDEWDTATNDDALPDGAKFADIFDRLLVEGEARIHARKDWHGKSGRVLSSATRERLAGHPAQLRTMAKSLDDLMHEADQGKSASPAFIESLMLEARLNGVSFGKAAARDVSTATMALNLILSLIENESDDLDPADPDYADDQADVATLGNARDALSAYIASTAKEVGSADDIVDAAEDEAAMAMSY